MRVTCGSGKSSRNEALQLIEDTRKDHSEQRIQALGLKKNNERWKRDKAPLATGAFRIPKPQMGVRDRGDLANWSGQVFLNAQVRGRLMTKKAVGLRRSWIRC